MNRKLHHLLYGNTMSAGVVSRQNYQFRNFQEENLRNCAYEVVMCVSHFLHSGFGGLVVTMLASGIQDRGFEPGRSRSMHFLRRGSKTVCPMSQICGM
jgi:hypothetical protein